MQLYFLLLAGLFGAALADDEAEIHLTNFDARIKDFLWCGVDSSILILRAENGKLFRGSSKGKIYKRILQELNGANASARVVKSEANPNLVYFLGGSGELWISNNCGDTSKMLKTGFPISQLRLHPSVSDWVLAQTSLEPRSLYLSQDSGLNWQKISENIIQAEWPFNTEQIKAEIAESTIYALTTSKQLLQTTDFFKSTKMIAEGIDALALTETFMFLTRPNELLVSSVHEHFVPTYSFTSENKSHFTVLHTTKSRALVLVTSSLDAAFGDLYVSDSYGSRFELSVRNCIYSSIHGADFARIEGVEGSYVANVMGDRVANDYKKLEEEKVEGAMATRKSKIATQLVQNNIKSFITYDYGKTWKYMRASDEELHSCFGDDICSLHLFIRRFTTVPLLSQKSSPGVIVANGNMGRSLNTNSLDRQVYMSRDGGYSWEQIGSKAHVHDMTDGGSIVAMAKLSSPVLRYSLNGGKEWVKEIMTRENATITAIFTEPNANGQYVLVLAEFFNVSIDESPRHSIYSISFGNLYTRKCRQDMEEGDYELWKPHYSKWCLMGRKVAYIRKRPSMMCYDDLKEKIQTEDCECSAGDYECDHGFVRVNSTCVPIVNDTAELCSLHKSQFTGYRKIAGDSCRGEMSYKSIECEYSVMKSSNVWTILLFVLSGVAMVGVYCVHLKSLEEKGELGRIKYEKASMQGEEEMAMKEYDV
eukprot:TRINITY_DN10553_c0_g1_i4.p1 TRINITY_DN10553_c0_g1~~TRINITY_DN10553_c0_g1_i4.p1  ORF type:complete len:705 (+),score=186.24 TRINITY_DN10553_c0_g1_i4:173-2287(+)